MKDLNNYIIEKILINRDTKIPSKYLSDASLTFQSREKFKEWLKTTFGTNIESFISGHLDIHKSTVYVFHREWGSDNYDDLDKIISDFRQVYGITDEETIKNSPKTISDDNHTCAVGIYDKGNYREIYIFTYRINSYTSKRDTFFIVQD